MKFYFTAVTIIACSALRANAFFIGMGYRSRSPAAFVSSVASSSSYCATVASSSSALFMSGFGEAGDFASAMPEKPQLSPEERMNEAATRYIADIESLLGEGVSAPPELEELRNLRDEGADIPTLVAKTYELMIEKGMKYDQDPATGMLTYTNYDIKGNLEIPEVKQEFASLYQYGMGLIAKGMVDLEKVKYIVQERLIKRTGLSPEEFDSWLGY
mmetsp:Transcript_37792/g.87984  ORF Transcript_37792/g.87984 Transcript_37792/m.87984 type:complete len:215 (-) Transcript_37792:471-1115(-)|eukprot:CAMPEP_0113313126 /NCGR_PEP_ID=MMETSP0010_2-20120614/9673_1 /TAXON_ID=216773 ORGANISM="Corethron hystrix, Strain 308" /NCGR_SAMPLE_ID=MMETSP0010_2 /ASSEMBLY_ACC=CAM_ASM_000155 /LENGTH=214 /DNA_ID=CAMNT_0000169073 /DNA_START=70 /DNA_END=714 /DNA_ORIENTATION=- /assembly_acc=CAM_ASM_000155